MYTAMFVLRCWRWSCVENPEHENGWASSSTQKHPTNPPWNSAWLPIHSTGHSHIRVSPNNQNNHFHPLIEAFLDAVQNLPQLLDVRLRPPFVRSSARRPRLRGGEL